MMIPYLIQESASFIARHIQIGPCGAHGTRDYSLVGSGKHATLNLRWCYADIKPIQRIVFATGEKITIKIL